MGGVFCSAEHSATSFATGSAVPPCVRPVQGGPSPAGSDPLTAPATHTAPQSGSRQRRLAADHHPGPDGKNLTITPKPCSVHETSNMQSFLISCLIIQKVEVLVKNRGHIVENKKKEWILGY